MREIPAQAADQFGVFTSSQAAAEGWSQDALERAVRAGQLRRLYRGAYASADPDPDLCPSGLPADLGRPSHHQSLRRILLQKATAGALVMPGASISHAGAAVAHRLPLLSVPQRPCLTVPAGVRTRHSELHLHRTGFRSPTGLRVTSVAQTCCDIASELGVADGVVVADAALHTRAVTRGELLATCEAVPPGRAAKAARQLFRQADGRSESPLETISRLAFSDFELAPQLQICVYAPSRRFLGRVDFLWPQLGVVGEADGSLKYERGARAEPLVAEKRRQDALTMHNLVVVRWGWSQARNPATLHELVRQGFAQARSLRSAGIHPTVTYGPGAADSSAPWPGRSARA